MSSVGLVPFSLVRLRSGSPPSLVVDTEKYLFEVVPTDAYPLRSPPPCRVKKPAFYLRRLGTTFPSRTSLRRVRGRFSTARPLITAAFWGSTRDLVTVPVNAEAGNRLAVDRTQTGLSREKLLHLGAPPTGCTETALSPSTKKFPVNRLVPAQWYAPGFAMQTFGTETTRNRRSI